RRSGILFGAHPGQCVVSPFTRYSVRTAVNAAIDGDSSAAARSEDHRENDMLARASSVGRFGNSKAVRVICTTYLASQHAAEIPVERFPIQPCRVGIFHQ